MRLHAASGSRCCRLLHALFEAAFALDAVLAVVGGHFSSGLMMASGLVLVTVIDFRLPQKVRPRRSASILRKMTPQMMITTEGQSMQWMTSSRE